MAAARGLTRLEAKAELHKNLDLYLSSLPFKTHLLVISTHHKRQQRPEVISVNKERLVAQCGEYYFIAVYYDLTYDYEQLHLIAHDALQLENMGSGTMWRIPLYLCQEEDRIVEPCPFSHYLDTELTMPKHFVFNEADMQRAFNIRLMLYRWFSLGHAYQDTHPFSSVDVIAPSGNASWGSSYAGNSPNIKVYDLLCYFYTARFCPATAVVPFIDGEERLLYHKLLLRPQLADRICTEMATEEIYLYDAISALRDFHKKNILRIRAMDASNFGNDSIKAMALKFISELERDAKQRVKDEEADEERIRLFKPVRAPITPKSNLCLADIRKCAPNCMKRLMDSAFGTDEQRAKMSAVQRNVLNRFLLEQKVDREDILAVVRPKVMIAYEMEPDAPPWKQIKLGLKNSEAEAELFKEDKGQFFMLCTDLMKLGLCAHMKPTPSNFHEMTLLQKKASGRARFIEAKKACHADVRNKWAQSSGKYLLRKGELEDWLDGPCISTHVAMKGPKANTKKKKPQAPHEKRGVEEEPEVEQEQESNKKQRV